MSDNPVHLYKSPAVVFGVLFLVAGLYFGADRDFGAWVIGLLVLPSLLLIAGLAAVAEAIVRTDKRPAMAALGFIIATPIAWYVAGKVQDRVRFAVWAPTHLAQLQRAARTDGVVTAWDSWGMAGEGNDSYLVSTRRIGFSSKERGSVGRGARASRARSSMHNGCGQGSTS